MSAKTKTEKTPVALKMPSTKETGVCKVSIISFLLLLIQNFSLSTTYIHTLPLRFIIQQHSVDNN